MARNKKSKKTQTYTLFNVTYEDGTLSSNRRVENQRLDESYGDCLVDLARKAIADQDNEIAQRSKERRGKIKSIVQVK